MSIDNGIWLCYRHGKLVDTDELRFTIPMLRHWRAIAELRARIEHETGRTLSPTDLEALSVGLANTEVQFSRLGEENEVLGKAVDDACVAILWGSDIAHAVRDLAIEVARNAITHGGATAFEMRIEERRILLVDNGRAFDPFVLLNEPSQSGGTQAMRYSKEHLSHRLLVSSQRVEHRNELVLALVKSAQDVRDLTPCTVELSYREMQGDSRKMTVLSTCSIVYAIIPMYFSVSDVYLAVRELRNAVGVRRLVFVVESVSPLVEGILREISPDAHLMPL